MNLRTHSDWKWALEPESKAEIEGIHLHHKVMSNYVNYTSKSNEPNNLAPLGQSVEFYSNKWISVVIRTGNEV